MTLILRNAGRRCAYSRLAIPNIEIAAEGSELIVFAVYA
jgi:hypothetical protein